MSSPTSSTSPEWTPARIDNPSGERRSRIATAAAMARPAPSNPAMKPSPAVLISRPSIAIQDVADGSIVRGEQLAPCLVAELQGARSRVDNVSDEQRHQHALPGALADPRPRSGPIDGEEGRPVQRTCRRGRAECRRHRWPPRRGSSHRPSGHAAPPQMAVARVMGLALGLALDADLRDSACRRRRRCLRDGRVGHIDNVGLNPGQVDALVGRSEAFLHRCSHRRKSTPSEADHAGRNMARRCR